MQVCKKRLMNITMNKMNLASLLLASSLSVATYGSPSFGQQAGISLSGESLGSLDSGPGQKFSRSQKSLILPLERKTRRNESFSSSFHVDMTEFDWRGSTVAQGEYLWLSMPVQYQQQRGGRNVFLLDFEPGVMTDGGNIGADHIAINGSLMGRRLWTNGGFWQYGLIVDRAFGDYDVRPVLGMGWQASKRTWIELGFPRVDVRHRLSSALQSFFVIKPVGGVWREEIKTDTTKEEVNLHYRSWQIGIGVDFHWRESLWLGAEIGQLRNRRVQGKDATIAQVKATPGQNRYWRIGASLKF